MKHLHIHSIEFKDTNPLLVQAIISYDETHSNYNEETGGFDEKFPFDKILYLDVADDVDVEIGFFAVKNEDNTYRFSKS
jgi:hypothetical protein